MPGTSCQYALTEELIIKCDIKNWLQCNLSHWIQHLVFDRKKKYVVTTRSPTKYFTLVMSEFFTVYNSLRLVCILIYTLIESVHWLQEWYICDPFWVIWPFISRYALKRSSNIKIYLLFSEYRLMKGHMTRNASWV